MITAFLGLAGGYWKPIAFVLVILAAFAYRAVLVHERDAARREVSSLTARNARLEAGINQLKAAIKRQNAAVDSLRQRADRATAMLAQQNRAATRRAAHIQAQARTAAGRMAHARINPGCTAAIEWGNREARELSQW